MSRPPQPPPAELASLIRKNLIRAGLSLLVLGAFAVFVMSQFRAELDQVTELVFGTIGLGGLVGLIFIADAVIAPFPPDTVLLLISNSEYHKWWGLLIPAIGVVSTVAGCLGFFGGSYFSHKPMVVGWFGATRVKSKKMILRYGPWAVAMGAMTPVPFSVTCWSAGLLHLPFRLVWKPCLLRIPRYVLYYAVIAYAPEILG